jgi:hypothetical protein
VVGVLRRLHRVVEPVLRQPQIDEPQERQRLLGRELDGALDGRVALGPAL